MTRRFEKSAPQQGGRVRRAAAEGLRAGRAHVARRLRWMLEEARELPDGYVLRFAEDGSVFGRLAEWVRHQGSRFPLSRFEMQAEGRCGSIRLRVTGPEGIKQFVRGQFAIAG